MTQIDPRWIPDNGVAGHNIRLLNNEYLRARNAANSADVNIGKLGTDDIFRFDLVPEVDGAAPLPSQPKQFVTIEYLENIALGKQDAKDAVLALADSQLALTGVAPFSVDGFPMVNGRIALTGQTVASQNGIYYCTITALTYALVRASDANSSAEVTTGMYFKVINGTVYSSYDVILTTPDPIVLDTTALTFIRNPSTQSMSAGDMLTRVGNVWAVDLATTSGLESDNPGNISGKLRIKTDTAVLEKDRTIKIDAGTNAIVAKRDIKEDFTLNATNITNQYIDLANVAGNASIEFYVSGGGIQRETDDYTVNYTGGASSKTRITLAGQLATGGQTALISGDKVTIKYRAF